MRSLECIGTSNEAKRVACKSKLSNERRYEECERDAGGVTFLGVGAGAVHSEAHTSGSVTLAYELGLSLLTVVSKSQDLSSRVEGFYP